MGAAVSLLEDCGSPRKNRRAGRFPREWLPSPPKRVVLSKSPTAERIAKYVESASAQDYHVLANLFACLSPVAELCANALSCLLLPLWR